MKQYKRSTRISEQLLRDISSLFVGGLGDSAPSMITFTHVRLTDDLKYATFYYSCLGDESKREATEHFLNKEKKHIRTEIGKNLHMRFIPEFRFKFDPSIEEGIKIEKLLNEIKDSEK